MRVIVHVHRSRTRDARSMAQKIEDLANRMAAALENLMGWAKTGDELQGHEFHGNQWTGGIGGGVKPTTVKAKSAKAGIHELLSSGHAFSKAELMQACGIKSEKLFSDYMAMLKNPKYAGPAGALEIVKNKDGSYQTQVKGDFLEAGIAAAEAVEKAAVHDPAPASAEEVLTAEKPQPEPEPKPAEAVPVLASAPLTAYEIATALQGINIAGIANTVMKADVALAKGMAAGGDKAGIQALAAKWAGTKAPKTQKAMASLLAALEKKAPAKAASHAPAPADLATPGSISKAQADSIYQATMAAAGILLKADLKNGIPADKAVLAYKNTKAAGMAKWAHDVHGAAYSPKLQGVFQADLQLAKDLKENGDTLDEALAKWKHNTSLEKQGLFPPKNPTYAHAAPVVAPPHVDMVGDPVSVKPVEYESLVPKAFKPIAADDLTKPNGFQGGISKFKSFLMYDKSSGTEAGAAQGNKKNVEHKLRARLKDKPNFQALVSRLGLVKEGSGSLEARLVSTWAGSSGDSNDLSVAVQLAVRDAFGMPDHHVEKKALTSLNHVSHEDEVVIKGIQSLNGNIKKLTPAEVPVAKAALREFVQAQYAETQALLKEGGFDHVYLARGMKLSAKHDPNEGAAQLRLQPASSFSTQYSTAKSFAGSGGTVFITKVPREQVLSTYVSGFGCTSEHEVVVLAHEKMRAFTVKATEASGHSQAAEAVASKISAPKPSAPAPSPKVVVHHHQAGANVGTLAALIKKPYHTLTPNEKFKVDKFKAGKKAAALKHQLKKKGMA